MRMDIYIRVSFCFDKSLDGYMRAAVGVTPDRPILIDRFLNHALECEADAISDGTHAFVPAVMEHIELAGVHSGDSACIIPSVHITAENVATIKEYTKKIAFSSQHLLGLINDVLDMSKIEAGKMKLTLEEENMDGIIENIDALVRTQMVLRRQKFEIIVELLKMEGAECTVCENGQLAVETFTASEENAINLLLMDVQMPVMNGYEATKAIPSSGHPMAETIPIIAMTANAFVEDIHDALDAGMNAHVAKPVDMQVLKETVAQVIGGRA